MVTSVCSVVIILRVFYRRVQREQPSRERCDLSAEHSNYRCSKAETPDTVDQSLDIKVDKQSEANARQFHVRQKLGLVYRQYLIGAFQFKNHLFINQNIDPIAAVQIDAFLFNGDCHLRTKWNIVQRQLPS